MFVKDIFMTGRSAKGDIKGSAPLGVHVRADARAKALALAAKEAGLLILESATGACAPNATRRRPSDARKLTN